jgi:hypothetical protein
MTKKVKLVVYLRKLGFNVEYQPDKIVCTNNGNNLIMFKRGMLSDREYERIGTALISSGYAVDDYDQHFLTKKPKKELLTNKDGKVNAKKILKNLEDNEEYFIEKAQLLLQIIQYPDVEHLVPHFLVQWCKDVGLMMKFNQDSHTDWWSCTIK